MKKKISKTYLLLFFALLVLMSVPKTPTEKLQGLTIATLAPAWHYLLAFKTFFPNNKEHEKSFSSSFEEMEKLRLENTLLKEEILHLKDVMQQELKLINQMNDALDIGEAKLSLKTLKSRHRLELKKLLQLHLNAIPAKIIFRSSESWNSSFWINVGSLTNQAIGSETVAKNSPVLIGNSVIGVIDYVGKQQARVRLITDSGLTPSVRALRGGNLSKIFDEKINSLIQMLKKNPGALDREIQQSELIAHLESAAEHLSQNENTHFLAKGELYGSSKPLWRSQRHLLKGIGFNYDYADGEGPARDLRTGKIPLQGSEEISTPIIEAGDLLVTTGMDGVFPAGLMVAEVTQVHPLKEGDYYYELDALPIAGNFDDLSLVFVIPPIGYDPHEQPSHFGGCN